MTFHKHLASTVAGIGLMLLCGGCAAQNADILVAQPVAAAAPAIPQQAVNYSVPENTTDPTLVERGVKEWLDRHPEYGGVRERAILRRMRIESRFNPCIANGPHHYLLQWRDSRVTGLRRSAGIGPRACPSWVAQMNWMDQEFRANPRFRSFFHTRTERAAYFDFSTRFLGGRA